MLGPPVAEERIEPEQDGLVAVTLKRAYTDGTVTVVMDPLSLLCRLAMSVPTSPPTFEDAGPVADARAERDPFIFVGDVWSVAAGFTHVGYWIFDPVAKRFARPSGCAISELSEDLGSRRLLVPAYWLQATPVSNRLYSDCVVAGACTAPDHDIGDPNPSSWNDPSRVEIPVHGRYDQAEAYCLWAKGRLPSMAELIRAAQGDAELPGVRDLTEAAINCFSPGAPGADAICRQLELMNYEQIPPPMSYRVGGFAADHGPFGHADLFGSVYEWTRTFIENIPGDQFCGIEDGSTDFVTFAQDPTSSSTHYLVKFATPVIRAIRGSNRALGAIAEPDYRNRYNYGFRCAFDVNPYGAR